MKSLLTLVVLSFWLLECRDNYDSKDVSKQQYSTDFVDQVLSTKKVVDGQFIPNILVINESSWYCVVSFLEQEGLESHIIQPKRSHIFTLPTENPGQKLWPNVKVKRVCYPKPDLQDRVKQYLDVFGLSRDQPELFNGKNYGRVIKILEQEEE